MEVQIQLGKQRLLCRARESGLKENAYEGTLETQITEATALAFWREYEDAVNGVLLAEVEKLEGMLSTCPFYVVWQGKLLQAADIDLQIYPSTGKFSFVAASE